MKPVTPRHFHFDSRSVMLFAALAVGGASSPHAQIHRPAPRAQTAPYPAGPATPPPAAVPAPAPATAPATAPDGTP